MTPQKLPSMPSRLLESKLDELLKFSADEVLNDRNLLRNLLELYSKIFLNSHPCSVCTKYHRAYYTKLSAEGYERIKKLKTMSKNSCKLKEDKVLFHKGTHYSNANITDNIAKQILKDFPALESAFESYPDGYSPKTDDVKVADAKKKLGEIKTKRVKASEKAEGAEKVLEEAEIAHKAILDENSVKIEEQTAVVKGIEAHNTELSEKKLEAEKSKALLNENIAKANEALKKADEETTTALNNEIAGHEKTIKDIDKDLEKIAKAQDQAGSDFDEATKLLEELEAPVKEAEKEVLNAEEKYAEAKEALEELDSEVAKYTSLLNSREK